MNSLSVSPNDYKFTILSAKLLWIYSSFSRIHFELTVFPAKYYEYTIYCELTIDPLSFQRIHCEFTISYVNSLWIHNLCREFTIESLSPNTRWIHFSELRIYLLFFSRSDYLSIIFFSNFITISRNHSEFTINFANLLWIYSLSAIDYLCRANTNDRLSLSRINYRFTIGYANSSWIHYRVRLLLICYANLLWFHDHFEFTFNFAN